MKKFHFILTLLFLISCDDDPVISASIVGTWKGTRAEVRVKPFGLPIPVKKEASFDTVVDFNEDGTITIHEGSSPQAGTWTMQGDEVTIDTDYTIEDVSITGVYEIQTLTDNSLELQMTKKRQTIVDPDNAPTVTGQVRITLYFRRM